MEIRCQVVQAGRYKAVFQVWAEGKIKGIQRLLPKSYVSYPLWNWLTLHGCNQDMESGLWPEPTVCMIISNMLLYDDIVTHCHWLKSKGGTAVFRLRRKFMMPPRFWLTGKTVFDCLANAILIIWQRRPCRENSYGNVELKKKWLWLRDDNAFSLPEWREGQETPVWHPT